MEGQFIKLGNTSFNKATLEGTTKEDFMKKYSGKIKGIDINEAWGKLKTFARVKTVKKKKSQS